MARFEDMTPTRRRVRGPIYDLVELEAEERRYVALVFHEGYRRTETPHGGVRAILDFLELPMVEGIAPLTVTLPSVAVYRTGRVRTVRELVALLAEEGGAGPRAALELFVAGAEALLDAAEAAQSRGLPNHGSLDPWSVTVSDTAGEGVPRVLILGYGLPAPDAADYLASAARVPLMDRLRYMPPERLAGAAEDVRSDLFGLALVCAELCTGRPLYEGKASEVLPLALRGAAAEQLGALPPEVSGVLAGVLAADPEERTTEVLDLARAAVGQVEGRSLREVVNRASRFVSEVEESLPHGFRALELLPRDPQRDEAGKRASAAAVRATAALTALETFRRGILERIDSAVPEVTESLASANQAMDDARHAAEVAREAGNRAMRAPDRSSASLAESEADAQADIARARSADARQALERAAKATEDAWTAAAELKAETARTHLERAAELRDRLQGDDRVQIELRSLYRKAREVARVVTSSRDPERQEQALEELAGLVRQLTVLEARSLAAEEAQAAVERAEGIRVRFGSENPELSALLVKVREAAEVAMTDPDGAAAQRGAERAVHAASQIEQLPLVLHTLQAEAGEAREMAEGALQVAEQAFSDVPHEDVEVHVRAARKSVRSARNDAAVAAVAAQEAVEHAEEARRVALELETLRAGARVRAMAALERADQAGAGMRGEAASQQMQTAKAAYADAQRAKLPAQAREAAARAERAASEIQRLRERLEHAQSGAVARVGAALSRAEEVLGRDDRRLEPLHGSLDEILQLADIDEVNRVADGVAASVKGLLEGSAIDDEVLEGVRQAARGAVEHAERIEQAVDHPDGRLHADAARRAGAEAESATSLATAELAAAEASRSAQALEVVRARAAVAMAEEALRVAGGPSVEDPLEACRDAAAGAEQAGTLAEAAEAASTAAEAAAEAVAAAEVITSGLQDFVVRAEASLAKAEAVLREASAVPADAGLADKVQAWVDRARAAVHSAREARTAAEASRAVREAQEAASEASEEVQRWEKEGHAARRRAEAAVAHAEEALEHANVPGVVDAIEQARQAAGEAMSSEAPEQAEKAADRAEQGAKAAHQAVSRHRQALAENIRRATLAVQEAESVLAESDVEGVRNALQLARTAAEEAAGADDVLVGEAAASTAEQAATAAVHAQERHLRQRLALHRETAADAAQRAAEAASVASDDDRVGQQASVARLAAEKAAATMDIAEAEAAADAAQAAADEAHAVIDGLLELARQRATDAAERVQGLANELNVPSLRALMLSCRQAAANAQRATTWAEAEEAAARAEQVAQEAQEEVTQRQRLLESAQERALGARNRAEEALTDPPLAAVMEAVQEARASADIALRSTDHDEAKRAADLADVAALRARSALEAQLSQLEVCRTRAKEALKRAEKALWEADLEQIRQALKDARAGVRHAVNTEDLGQAERGARRAEQAATTAETALRERKEEIGALTLRAEEAVRRAEEARRSTGVTPEMGRLVEQARAAASAVLRAVDPGEAEAQAGLAETAAHTARTLADDAIASRAGARRRAARALAQLEEAVESSDLPQVTEAVVTAREALVEAESARDPAAAVRAADRAESAARVAEEAIERGAAAIAGVRGRAEAALSRAREVLQRAAGPIVEAHVVAARRAAEAASGPGDLDTLEEHAAQAEAAGALAEEAADVAQERCRTAREAAEASYGRARAALATLDHELVRTHVMRAEEARQRTLSARDPAIAEAGAQEVAQAAELAEQAVGVGEVQRRANEAVAAVDRATVSVPEGAPPQLVAMADQVWSLVRQVQHEAKAANEATEAETARQHAEQAAVIAGRALHAQRDLQGALDGWRNDLKNQARTGLKALRGLMKRLQTVTDEVRALARTREILHEAEACDQSGLAAGGRAQEAARSGDPDGVRAGLNDLRKVMKHAQRVLERARELAGRRPPVSAGLRRALQRAVEESGLMADEARRMLAGRPDSDAAWHAQRAMEAAQAARMTAKSALGGAASDEDITRVVNRLERALKALARVRQHPVAVEGTALEHLRQLQANAPRASVYSEEESVGDPETVSDAPTLHDGLSESGNPDDEATHITVRQPGQPLSK